MNTIKENICDIAFDILETIKEPLIILNLSKEVVYANKSFHIFFKTTFQEIKNQSFFEICNGTWNIPRLNEHLSKVIPDKRLFEDFELEIEFSNIGKKDLLLDGREVVNQTNGDRLILLVLEDITEKKKLLNATNQKLKLAAIGHLTAGIAHGLTSPLTGIHNILDVYFRTEKVGSEKYRELKLMLESCDYMSDIIQNLTQFAGRHNEGFDRLDLDEVISSTIQLIERQFLANNIEVIKEVSRGPFKILGSKSDLQHLLLNIILNAKESITDKGKIVIKMQRRNNELVLEISDTGSGIDENQLDKIFEPFFTTKKSIGGAGLGLSAAYGIVKNHSGDIIVESKKGEGTKFTITFPIAK